MELVEKYLRYLRYEKNYSSHTEISYFTDLGQFSEFLNSKCEGAPLQDADGDMIRQWIVSLIGSGVSARSVNRKLSSLKSFYRYLIRVGEMKQSPMKKVIAPKMAKPIPSFVNYADMATVLDAPLNGSDFDEYRNRVIMELFYVTGMRRAELIGLKDGDIDLYTDTIKVLGKRNKQRLIPISAGTKELISTYIDLRNGLEAKQSGSFFVRENGEPLYPMLVHRIVTSCLQWIPTLAKTSPHVLRHSFATGMLNNGAELNAVKELLGHSSLASTEVYTHTSFEELKKAYNKAHPRA